MTSPPCRRLCEYAAGATEVPTLDVWFGGCRRDARQGGKDACAAMVRQGSTSATPGCEPRDPAHAPSDEPAPGDGHRRSAKQAGRQQRVRAPLSAVRLAGGKRGHRVVSRRTTALSTPLRAATGSASAPALASGCCPEGVSGRGEPPRVLPDAGTSRGPVQHPQGFTADERPTPPRNGRCDLAFVERPVVAQRATRLRRLRRERSSPGHRILMTSRVPVGVVTARAV